MNKKDLVEIFNDFYNNSYNNSINRETQLYVVKKLIEDGMDADAKVFYHKTPLYYATIDNNIKLMKYLIEKGADVNVKDEKGKTPLHIAARDDEKEMFELLIEKGADVNAKDEDGWTPLHYAAYNDNKEICKILISKNADINAKDNDCETPLDEAFKKDYNESIELLKQYGAKTYKELQKEKMPVYNRFHFRCWDIESKYMFYDGLNNWVDTNIKTHDCLGLSLGGDIYRQWGYADGEAELDNLIEKATDKYILMQSTGLVDKNGKEIFEGDIVNIIKGFENFKDEVFYDKQLCSIRLKGYSNEFCDFADWIREGFEFEVIGNIYENKELLNE